MYRYIIAGVLSVFLAVCGVSEAAEAPHAVLVVGTHHYSPQRTMPHLAKELKRLGIRVTVINPDWDPEKDNRGLPGLEALADADIGVFFVRFLKLDDEQVGHITRFVESGKPVVGLRTSTHAFNYPAGHPQERLNSDFGRETFGSPYRIHLSGKTQIRPLASAKPHPILAGVDATQWESSGTLYLVDFESGIEPLLVGTGRSKRVGTVTNQFGRHELQEMMTAPVAWTWTNKWGGRVFTTSLGHVDDFSEPNSLRVVINGVFWAAGQPVPSEDIELKPFERTVSSSRRQHLGRPRQRTSSGKESRPIEEAAKITAARRDRANQKPNVVIVMTDDQGYGDLACHGNPVLQTPNLDQLYTESVRLTDFHVSPFCTPTRAALMTGHYPGFTGAYRTSSGRTMLHRDEKTIANLFGDNGYATGMVGKWHLGDNAPHRPQDRGFQDVVWHRCGGVGQASDFWGNDYFDDTYDRNGAFEKFDGYCTDVWFREGMRFIEENKDRPFLLYLPTNAPHGPYRVPEKWAKPYVGRDDVVNANFLGMIANIDHNVGLLRDQLQELKLTENTIFIFMTDNGTAAGARFRGLDSEPIRGFNAGMRGKKSSIYDGGHRVPFFIYWPAGQLIGGKDVDTLAAHIDVLPTLADLVGISVPSEYRPQGVSLKPLLDGSGSVESGAVGARDHHVIQFLGGAGGTALPPQPFENAVVLTEKWRLVHSNRLGLFDIESDPAQRNDVSAERSDVVERLRADYQQFWKKVAPRLTPVRIDLGNPRQNPTVLCSQDWYMPNGNPPWNFGSIKKLPKVTGPWMVEVQTAGRYRLTLRQYPAEAEMPVVAERAKIEIAGQVHEQAVDAGTDGVVFEIDLQAGPTELVTYLYDENGKAGGAYFTEVEALSK